MGNMGKGEAYSGRRNGGRLPRNRTASTPYQYSLTTSLTIQGSLFSRTVGQEIRRQQQLALLASWNVEPIF